MWHRLLVPRCELRLDITLQCGQSFRWKQIADGNWQGVLGSKVFVLAQKDEHIEYQVFEQEEPPVKKKKGSKTRKTLIDELQQCPPSGKVGDGSVSAVCGSSENDSILRDYFQLRVSIHDLYAHWKEQDPKFGESSTDFTGVRILRQDPVENLFSFICSSNNNISRITGMVEKLCVEYGECIRNIGDTPHYAFPSVEALAGKSVESKLRDLGFGYRAKYISQAARALLTKGDGWLEGLRSVDYVSAKKELIQLPGVGPKVADCVLLMSLDKPGAVPVDTHVWQIAARDYLPELKAAKSVTDKLYNKIGDHFRELWGDYAGWAHSVLFSADLRSFQHLKKQGQAKTDRKRPSCTDTTTKKTKRSKLASKK